MSIWYWYFVGIPNSWLPIDITIPNRTGRARLLPLLTFLERWRDGRRRWRRADWQWRWRRQWRRRASRRMARRRRPSGQRHMQKVPPPPVASASATAAATGHWLGSWVAALLYARVFHICPVFSYCLISTGFPLFHLFNEVWCPLFPSETEIMIRAN